MFKEKRHGGESEEETDGEEKENVENSDDVGGL